MKTAINLQHYKSLFRDEDSLRKMADVFKQAVKDGAASPVLSGEEVLCTAVSLEMTRDILLERILARLAADPQRLDTLIDRIENDDIVD